MLGGWGGGGDIKMGCGGVCYSRTSVVSPEGIEMGRDVLKSFFIVLRKIVCGSLR